MEKERHIPLLENEPSYATPAPERLGAFAVDLSELDTSATPWQPAPERKEYLADMFTEKLYYLDLTEGESALINEILAELVTARFGKYNNRSAISLETRIKILDEFIEGAQARELAEKYGTTHTIVSNIPSTLKEELVQSDDLFVNYRKLVERLIETRGDSFDPLKPWGPKREAIPNIELINFEEGAILSHQEVAVALVELLGLDEKEYWSLSEFLSADSVEKSLVTKRVQIEAAMKLREKLAERITEFSELALDDGPLPTRHTLIVRRVLGGELNLKPKDVNPRAVHELTFSNGGRNYELVEQIGDAFSALAVKLKQRFTPVKPA